MSDPLFYDAPSASHAQQLKTKIKSMNPYIIGFLSISMLVVIALSIWAFYPTKNVDPDSLPVIYAETDPIRVKPEENATASTQGDSYIYETFSAHNPERRIENLLKPEDIREEPVSREELFAGLKPEIQVRAPQNEAALSEAPPFPEQPSAEELSAPAPVTSKVAEHQSPPGIFITVPDHNTASVQDAEIAEKTEPAAGVASIIPDKQPAPVVKTQDNGTHFVQLASFQDANKAPAAWKDLVKKHALLEGINYRTQTADIPGKGAYTRIQAGPFSKEQATSLCDKIKGNGGSCLIVAR